MSSSSDHALVSREYVTPRPAAMEPRARSFSHVATLYVVDVAAVTDAMRAECRDGGQYPDDARVVRYGRYIDAMSGAPPGARVVATAYVDSDRLRAAERVLEDFFRKRGLVMAHPAAVLPGDAVPSLRDFMTVVTARFSGTQDEAIARMERTDADHATQVRHLKQRLRLREEELRLKEYELRLKDHELSLREDEAAALREQCGM